MNKKSVVMLSIAAALMLCIASLSGFTGWTSSSSPAGHPAKGKTLYDFKVTSLDGQPLDLAKYRGNKVLIVNTASKCGFTPQYAKLQALHEKMGDKLVILGFPANNFAGQEPGTNSEIAGFCKKNYGVTFQMCEKVSVKGDDQAPLYKWLTNKEENGWNDKVPTWNFCKYLINEKGQLTNFWESKVDPMGPEIAAALSK